MNAKRLDDWAALCDYLEGRPYNASYDPNHPAAYLLTGLYSPRKTIQVDDLDRPPLVIMGREVLRKKDVPNPDLAKEKEIARHCREIVKERRSIGLVFWSSGHGWRLHKDYREVLAKLRERIGTEDV